MESLKLAPLSLRNSLFRALLDFLALPYISDNPARERSELHRKEDKQKKDAHFFSILSFLAVSRIFEANIFINLKIYRF